MTRKVLAVFTALLVLASCVATLPTSSQIPEGPLIRTPQQWVEYCERIGGEESDPACKLVGE